jgi:hypothetical protein
MAAKKPVLFRLDEETTLSQLDALIPILSEALKVKMDRTKVIEYLVSNRFDSYYRCGMVPNDSEGSET